MNRPASDGVPPAGSEDERLTPRAPRADAQSQPATFGPGGGTGPVGAGGRRVVGRSPALGGVVRAAGRPLVALRLGVVGAAVREGVRAEGLRPAEERTRWGCCAIILRALLAPHVRWAR